jgi:hypothetical protein
MRGGAKTRAEEGVGGVSELNVKSFLKAQNVFRAARIAAAARARGAIDTPTAPTDTAASANSAATPHTLAASAAHVDVAPHIASAVLHEPMEVDATAATAAPATLGPAARIDESMPDAPVAQPSVSTSIDEPMPDAAPPSKGGMLDGDVEMVDDSATAMPATRRTDAGETEPTTPGETDATTRAASIAALQRVLRHECIDDPLELLEALLCAISFDETDIDEGLFVSSDGNYTFYGDADDDGSGAWKELETRHRVLMQALDKVLLGQADNGAIQAALDELANALPEMHKAVVDATEAFEARVRLYEKRNAPKPKGTVRAQRLQHARTQLTHAASRTQLTHAAHSRSSRTQLMHADSRTQIHARTPHARSSRTQLTHTAHTRSSRTQIHARRFTHADSRKARARRSRTHIHARRFTRADHAHISYAYLVSHHSSRLLWTQRRSDAKPRGRGHRAKQAVVEDSVETANAKLRDQSRLSADSTDRELARKLYSGRLASKFFDGEDDVTEGVVSLLPEDPEFAGELWFQIEYPIGGEECKDEVDLDALHAVLIPWADMTVPQMNAKNLHKDALVAEAKARALKHSATKPVLAQLLFDTLSAAKARARVEQAIETEEISPADAEGAAQDAANTEAVVVADAEATAEEETAAEADAPATAEAADADASAELMPMSQEEQLKLNFKQRQITELSALQGKVTAMVRRLRAVQEVLAESQKVGYMIVTTATNAATTPTVIAPAAPTAPTAPTAPIVTLTAAPAAARAAAPATALAAAPTTAPTVNPATAPAVAAAIAPAAAAPAEALAETPRPTAGSTVLLSLAAKLRTQVTELFETRRRPANKLFAIMLKDFQHRMSIPIARYFVTSKMTVILLSSKRI